MPWPRAPAFSPLAIFCVLWTFLGRSGNPDRAASVPGPDFSWGCPWAKKARGEGPICLIWLSGYCQPDVDARGRTSPTPLEPDDIYREDRSGFMKKQGDAMLKAAGKKEGKGEKEIKDKQRF